MEATAASDSRTMIAAPPVRPHCEVRRDDPSQSARMWRTALWFVAATCAVLPFDIVLSRWICRIELNSELNQLLQFSESFAHGLGVLVVLSTCAMLMRSERRKIWLVAAMAFSAGIAADILKVVIHRIRPSSADHLRTVWDTFAGFGFQSTEISRLFDHTYQSFPSAHAATAFGLACGMGWMLGRARRYFLVLALLSSLQRVVSGAHFPSDVLAGACLGMFVAGLWLKPYGLAPLLRRWLVGPQLAPHCDDPA